MSLSCAWLFWVVSQGSGARKHAVMSRSWESGKASENGHGMFGRAGIVYQSGWECRLFRKSRKLSECLLRHFFAVRLCWSLAVSILRNINLLPDQSFVVFHVRTYPE